MEQNLQEFNTNQNLLEWSQRISDCKNSGMSMKDWCETNGITLSTYYNWQRKVFEAVKSAEENKDKTQFAEIRLPQRATPTV